MKHGPLALIEEGLPVIVIAPKDKYFEKTISKHARSNKREEEKSLLSQIINKELINENIRLGRDVPRIIRYTYCPQYYLTVTLTNVSLSCGINRKL